MQGADKGIEQELDGLGLHIGIVQARYNEDITNALAVACIQELEALGVHDIDHVLVPGALEVPIALQAMAERGESTMRWWPWVASFAAKPITSNWWPMNRGQASAALRLITTCPLPTPF
ncbi:MAG: 6,7-dimethyl-8-ribityllumazine synthase [Pseudomonadota bacterium]|jgi:hypothetical protein